VGRNDRIHITIQHRPRPTMLDVARVPTHLRTTTVTLFGCQAPHPPTRRTHNPTCTRFDGTKPPVSSTRLGHFRLLYRLGEAQRGSQIVDRHPQLRRDNGGERGRLVHGTVPHIIPAREHVACPSGVSRTLLVKFVLCCTVLCCVVLCCAVLYCAVLFCAVLCRPVPCCAVVSCAGCAVWCHAVLCCVPCLCC
jgi:hypothetical protein